MFKGKVKEIFDIILVRELVIPKLVAWIFVIAGFILFIIGLPDLFISLLFWSYVGVFDAKGILMMIVGVYLFYLGYKNVGFILRREEVLDRWGILIENGKGRSEDVFKDTERFIRESEAPKIEMERREVSPTILKDIIGVRRDFLEVTDEENPKLENYKIFINARDYGNNLDVSWYLTYKMSLLEAILALRGTYMPKLDLFDEQDLRAYVTNAHHSLLKAVEKQMLSLNQDSSKIDKRSRGFLGIS